MEKNPQNQKSRKKLLENYARYSSIAGQMIVIILAGIFAGIQIDKWLNMSIPVFTVILSFLAVILSMYIVIKNVMKK